MLVEGITEEILLKAFSVAARVDFNKNGIKIVPSGGKKKILKQYSRLCGETDLPIMPILMIFDSDGQEQAETARNNLRNTDGICVIPRGEFEDILPEKLICKAVNSHYRLLGKICPADISPDSESGTGCIERRAQVLERLWQEKGFGKFRKAEFATIVAGHVNKKTDLSPELNTIFAKIKNMLDFCL